MRTLKVVPAYGRDYKSMQAAKDDWEAGKDFKICDISDPYDGKAINKADAYGIAILARYDKLRKVAWLQNEPQAPKRR